MMEPLENCSGVYLIVNSVNGHSYVGSSVNVLKRVWSHLGCHKGSAIIAAAIRKHGREYFVGFLLERIPRADLPAREGWWMEKLNPEYNASRITSTGGRIISPEQRAKISRALKGRPLSPERRAKIIQRLTGRSCSTETKAKIAAALVGRIFRPESIAKMRLASQNMTDKRRAKMSASAIGRTVSQETRHKKRAALKGKPWSDARRMAFVEKHYKL